MALRLQDDLITRKENIHTGSVYLGSIQVNQQGATKEIHLGINNLGALVLLDQKPSRGYISVGNGDESEIDLRNSLGRLGEVAVGGVSVDVPDLSTKNNRDASRTHELAITIIDVNSQQSQLLFIPIKHLVAEFKNGDPLLSLTMKGILGQEEKLIFPIKLNVSDLQLLVFNSDVPSGSIDSQTLVANWLLSIVGGENRDNEEILNNSEILLATAEALNIDKEYIWWIKDVIFEDAKSPTISKAIRIFQVLANIQALNPTQLPEAAEFTAKLTTLERLVKSNFTAQEIEKILESRKEEQREKVLTKKETEFKQKTRTWLAENPFSKEKVPSYFSPTKPEFASLDEPMLQAETQESVQRWATGLLDLAANSTDDEERKIETCLEALRKIGQYIEKGKIKQIEYVVNNTKQQKKIEAYLGSFSHGIMEQLLKIKNEVSRQQLIRHIDGLCTMYFNISSAENASYDNKFESVVELATAAMQDALHSKNMQKLASVSRIFLQIIQRVKTGVINKEFLQHDEFLITLERIDIALSPIISNYRDTDPNWYQEIEKVLLPIFDNVAGVRAALRQEKLKKEALEQELIGGLPELIQASEQVLITYDWRLMVGLNRNILKLLNLFTREDYLYNFKEMRALAQFPKKLLDLHRSAAQEEKLKMIQILSEAEIMAAAIYFYFLENRTNIPPEVFTAVEEALSSFRDIDYYTINNNSGNIECKVPSMEGREREPFPDFFVEMMSDDLLKTIMEREYYTDSRVKNFNFYRGTDADIHITQLSYAALTLYQLFTRDKSRYDSLISSANTQLQLRGISPYDQEKIASKVFPLIQRVARSMRKELEKQGYEPTSEAARARYQELQNYITTITEKELPEPFVLFKS